MEEKHNKLIQTALTRMEYVTDKPLEEYKHAITVQLSIMTGSTLSYFATMNSAENVLTMIGWSKSAMGNCSMIDKPIVYKIEETGLWGDAVRERKPVITNDYKNLVKPTKKGYPEGHVHVVRHMNVPIFDGNRIVMVVGVGNKATEYDQEDARNMISFMTEVWKVLKIKL
jgi:GAF domain-containing protein